jgi:hypothetical protein
VPGYNRAGRAGSVPVFSVFPAERTEERIGSREFDGIVRERDSRLTARHTTERVLLDYQTTSWRKFAPRRQSSMSFFRTQPAAVCLAAVLPRRPCMSPLVNRHLRAPLAAAGSPAPALVGVGVGSSSSSSSHNQTRAHSSHGHSHGHDGHSHGVEQTTLLAKSLSSKGQDRGSRITLVGLASNVVLLGAKGIGGW